MSIPQLLTLLVIFVGVPIVSIELVALVRVLIAKPKNVVARFSVVTISIAAIIVFVFAIVFRNNDTVPPPFTLFQTQIATRLAILALATIPGTYLLWHLRPKEMDERREVELDTADVAREVKRDEADAAREVKRDEADAAREKDHDQATVDPKSEKKEEDKELKETLTEAVTEAVKDMTVTAENVTITKEEEKK